MTTHPARLLITGGSSYLGQHLVPLARQAGWETFYTWYSADPLGQPGGMRLDLRLVDDVLRTVDEIDPAVIIHLAGSNRTPDMERVIEGGAAAVVEAAGQGERRLIFMSTDVVFDGRHPPYSETDLPNPVHAYGRAKAAAEQIVQGSPNHVIVRTSLIYGLEWVDRGTAWMIDALQKGQPVTLFTDQLRNPVWVNTLAEACLELAVNDYRGVLHVAGSQILSRAAFGERLLDWWGVASRVGLQAGPMPDGAPWPADTTLDISRARQLLKTRLWGVDELLEKFDEDHLAGQSEK